MDFNAARASFNTMVMDKEYEAKDAAKIEESFIKKMTRNTDAGERALMNTVHERYKSAVKEYGGVKIALALLAEMSVDISASATCLDAMKWVAAYRTIHPTARPQSNQARGRRRGGGKQRAPPGAHN